MGGVGSGILGHTTPKEVKDAVAANIKEVTGATLYMGDSAASLKYAGTIAKVSAELQERFPGIKAALHPESGNGALRYIELKDGRVLKDVTAVAGKSAIGLYEQEYDRISFASGSTSKEEGALRTGKSVYTVDNSQSGTFRHELGHAYYSRMPSEDRNNWARMAGPQRPEAEVKERVSRIGQYAMTNSKESFAEAFCAYTHQSYSAGKLPGEIESFLSKSLGK